MEKTNRDKDSCCCRFCSVPRYPRPRRGYGRTSTGSWKPKNKNRARFRDRIIVGDSGNPAFLLIKDQPILIYCLLRGGCGSGPSIHLYRREIQAAMTVLRVSPVAFLSLALLVGGAAFLAKGCALAFRPQIRYNTHIQFSKGRKKR